MTEMTIRQADVNDVDVIYEIETHVVAEIDQEVVGYAGLWWILDEGHITNVAVKPGFRNRRIGSQIIEAMLEHTGEQGIRHYTLEVRASNVSARALYEKFGFEVRPNDHAGCSLDKWITAEE